MKTLELECFLLPPPTNFERSKRNDENVIIIKASSTTTIRRLSFYGCGNRYGAEKVQEYENGNFWLMLQ